MSDFCINNKIFFDDKIITSLDELNNKLPNYNINFDDKCRGNLLYLNSFMGKGKINIYIRGNNNSFEIGIGNKVEGNMNVQYIPNVAKLPMDNKIVIGDKNFFNGNITVRSGTDSGIKINIGNLNLFANNVMLKAVNDHGVFDIETGKKLNPDNDVYIGNKNWIGTDVTFFPKAYVSNNSVVGAKSFVNKVFKENNILIAGIPALVKKSNIMWNCSDSEDIYTSNPDQPLSIHNMFWSENDSKCKNMFVAKEKIYINYEELYHKSLIDLKNKGVKVITLSTSGGSENWKRIADKVQSRKPTDDIYKEFYGELYRKGYGENIWSITYSNVNSVILKDGCLRMADISFDGYNVCNGERKTENQPLHYDRTIYFFGHCYVFGAFVEDKYTIETYLQNLINKNNLSIRVVNYGFLGNHSFLKYIDLFSRVKFKPNDIVITGLGHHNYDDIEDISVVELMDKGNITDKDMLNHYLHINPKANELLANAIYNKLRKCIDRRIIYDKIDEDCCITLKHGIDLYIETYFHDFMKMNNNSIIGAIVMNCNPFTNGHKYLIEHAASQVDRLIIFVVEEDKSEFSFNDRYQMVIKGCRHINNLYIVPSGQYILSNIFFPEYFGKNMNGKVKENSRNDVIFWAENVAKKLNIKYRFVGEEKNDEVTSIYNDAMKEILPKYNITLVEIPRKISQKTIISASLVRKYLKEDKLSEIYKLVPNTTFEYIVKDKNIAEKFVEEIECIHKNYKEQHEELSKNIKIIEKFKKFFTAHIELEFTDIDYELVGKIDSPTDYTTIKIIKPFSVDSGVCLVESIAGSVDLNLNIENSYKLKVTLKGIDDENAVWLEYTLLKINEQILFDTPKLVSSKKPLSFDIQVAEGQKIDFHIEYRPAQIIK